MVPKVCDMQSHSPKCYVAKQRRAFFSDLLRLTTFLPIVISLVDDLPVLYYIAKQRRAFFSDSLRLATFLPIVIPLVDDLPVLYYELGYRSPKISRFIVNGSIHITLEHSEIILKEHHPLLYPV